MALLNLLLLFGLIISLLTWLSPSNWQRWILLIGTILFLGLNAPVSLIILVITTLTSYWIFQKNLKVSIATAIVLLQNTGLFVIYKLGIAGYYLSPMDRLIPLGLSYYAFRQIHYAIEQYKEKIVEHNFWDYANYMFFLPTILIGPINKFQPFLRNIYRRRWDEKLFSEGLERILYGYAKVVIIGNYLLNLKLNSFISSIEQKYEWFSTYLDVFCYMLNTYFQFAGYSDVAIGLALLLGFRVIENFNYPFFASNINDFWNRWHISLSSWCKDYVYTPMASITRKPIIGILMTMIVIGLWHEISLKYIVWGGFHGIGIAIWHIYTKTNLAKFFKEKILGYNYFSIFLTFHFVLLSFIIVKEENWSEMINVFQILLNLNQ